MKRFVSYFFVISSLFLAPISSSWATKTNETTITRSLVIDSLIQAFERREKTSSDVLKVSASIIKKLPNDCKAAMRLLDQVRQAKIAPDVVLYNATIHICALAGFPDAARALLDEMAGYELTPNVKTYSSVIDGYAKAGLLIQALDLLAEMKESNITPNETTYTSVIDAYAKAGLPNQAFKMLIEMRENNISPSVIPYTAVIDTYVKAGLLNQALKLLTEMKENNITPDEITYTSIFNGYATLKKLHEALPLFKSLIGEIYSDSILTSDTLDFHENSFYTKSYFQKISIARPKRDHVTAVSRSLALLALLARSQSKTIPFPSRIIVGRHGENILKTAVQEYLSSNGYIWNQTQNRGRLENVRMGVFSRKY